MIVDLLFIAAAIAVLIVIYRLKFSKENLEQQIDLATKNSQQQKDKKNTETHIINEQKKVQKQSATEQQPQQRWANDSESSEQSNEEVVDFRKQMRKQQKQKQKKQRKQAHENFLQREKQKRQKYEKEAQERQKLQEQKRKKQQEIIEQLRQQQRKRKQQQFNKWKDMFKVEQQGKQKLSQEEQKRKQQTFNRELVSYLKKYKLSLLEDLSHKFKLSTKQLVQKIKQLQSLNLISGIFDERGKYLVVEQIQWNSIKNYIKARGRVKKTDIMTECARLIKIPDNIQEDLLNLVKDDTE